MITLDNTVIKNGFCIGCGACASLKASPYKISMNKLGQYQADLVGNTNQEIEKKVQL